MRGWVKSIGVNPRDYLSRYHESTKKTNELWPHVTKGLLDALAENDLLSHFTQYPSNDMLTWLDHSACGGSASVFIISLIYLKKKFENF